jgi:hypothetical protein
MGDAERPDPRLIRKAGSSAEGEAAPWDRATQRSTATKGGVLRRVHGEQMDEKPSVGYVGRLAERVQQTHDIFEGTEQVQQLVIARAISGLRIE